MTIPAMRKLRTVEQGATIGVVASGSPVEPTRFAQGRRALEERGYKLEIPYDPCKHYASNEFFANGSRLERIEALMSLVRNKDVAAIFTARGGYGTSDLLSMMDFEELAASQKAIVGLSDVTVLLMALVSQAKLYAVHGPAFATSIAQSAISGNAEDLRSVDSLFSLLSDADYLPEYQCQEIRSSQGEGPLIGGNLSMLTTLIGTPWDMSYNGAILVLEEVGDAPFRIHRCLSHLKYAGKLDNLAGLVFGRFSRCEAQHGPGVDQVIENIVEQHLKDSKFPILKGFSFGHWGENQALALGCRARIENELLKVIESPLQIA